MGQDNTTGERGYADMFRPLTPSDARVFRQWARDHHAPGDAIDVLWHPIVRDECERIDREATSAAELAELRERFPRIGGDR